LTGETAGGQNPLGCRSRYALEPSEPVYAQAKHAFGTDKEAIAATLDSATTPYAAQCGFIMDGRLTVMVVVKGVERQMYRELVVKMISGWTIVVMESINDVSVV
jgi:hypothetical protein